jgi:parallel beta-helix repeat protein
VTVKNCHVTGSTIGFNLFESSGNTFEENTANGNDGFDAVQVGTSTGNLFEDNDFSTTFGI